MTDPISDMLTRIRNALMAKKAEIVFPFSNFKYNLAQLLVGEGWIKNVNVKEQHGQKNLMIQLRYTETGVATISEIKRVSRPGQRIYSKNTVIPRTLGGMGTTVVSTSKGLMTDKQARQQHLGGEIICQIW